MDQIWASHAYHRLGQTIETWQEWNRHFELLKLLRSKFREQEWYRAISMGLSNARQQVFIIANHENWAWIIPKALVMVPGAAGLSEACLKREFNNMIDELHADIQVAQQTQTAPGLDCTNVHLFEPLLVRSPLPRTCNTKTGPSISESAHAVSLQATAVMDDPVLHTDPRRSNATEEDRPSCEPHQGGLSTGTSTTTTDRNTSTTTPNLSQVPPHKKARTQAQATETKKTSNARNTKSTRSNPQGDDWDATRVVEAFAALHEREQAQEAATAKRQEEAAKREKRKKLADDEERETATAKRQNRDLQRENRKRLDREEEDSRDEAERLKKNAETIDRMRSRHGNG
jgi:DNA segregation ATPase FtsK/SpoIIIE-like protein